MKKISVVGLGYIGLPTALIAAEHGYQVSGFDIDEQKIKTINEGICPIIEPGVEDILTKVLEQKSFAATTTLEAADCFIIAVPTPFKMGKKANLTYVMEAGKAIAQKLQPGNLVLLESPPKSLEHSLKEKPS